MMMNNYWSKFGQLRVALRLLLTGLRKFSRTEECAPYIETVTTRFICTLSKILASLNKFDIGVDETSLDKHGSFYSNSAINYTLDLTFAEFPEFHFCTLPVFTVSSERWWNDTFSFVDFTSQNLWVQLSTCQAIYSRDLEEEQSVETVKEVTETFHSISWTQYYFYFYNFTNYVALLRSQKCSEITANDAAILERSSVIFLFLSFPETIVTK